MWFNKQITFAELAEKVLNLKQLKSEKTRTAATFHITRLTKTFGSRRPSKIGESDWTQYILLESAKKSRTFFDDKKYMRMILLYGQREGLVKNQIRLPIPDLPSDAGREISQVELQLLLAHANPQLAFQIQISYKMGFRLREMLHLKWDRFDWKRKTVRLKRVDTKTRRGREVPITSDLYRKFRALFALSNSPYVFPHRFDPNRPQHDNKSAWIRLKRRVGISCRWHDLRHTCATVMLRKKVPDHIVRRYLGMSKSVLHSIYAHLNIEDLRIAADAMTKH